MNMNRDTKIASYCMHCIDYIDDTCRGKSEDVAWFNEQFTMTDDICPGYFILSSEEKFVHVRGTNPHIKDVGTIYLYVINGTGAARNACRGLIL